MEGLPFFAEVIAQPGVEARGEGEHCRAVRLKRKGKTETEKSAANLAADSFFCKRMLLFRRRSDRGGGTPRSAVAGEQVASLKGIADVVDFGRNALLNGLVVRILIGGAAHA